MSTDSDDPKVNRLGQQWAQALNRLSEEDRRLLTMLGLMGQLVDPRYATKGVTALVARALVDPDFRARLLANADEAAAELRGRAELPEGVYLRVVENSPQELTIVLPPPSQELNERSRTVRDFVFSRTSADLQVLSAGVDDNDVLPVVFPDAFTGDSDAFHLGDASHDG